MKQESLGRTLLVAFAIIFICSLFVSGAVTLLRPIQAANKAPQDYPAILQVAGLIKFEDKSIDQQQLLELFQQVEPRLLDLDSARILTKTTEKEFDYRLSMNNPETTITLEKKDDLALLGQRPKTMPIYWIHSSSSNAKLVLPIYGKGMWSMIHGYIALKDDFNTIAGIYFYQQGETPGIGERIQAEDWLKSWQGKKLYDNKANLALFVNGHSNESQMSIYRIDGISGATKTVDGVINLVRFWFDKKGYQLFLIEQAKIMEK